MASDRFGLTDKVAVITGAGSGIGRATALMMAASGARVVIAEIDMDGAEAVRAEIVAGGGSATAVKCDICDETQVEHLLSAAVAGYGRVDVLINNAGAVFKGDCIGTTLRDWNRVLDVNVTGAFLCCKHAIPRMLANGGGTIVNVAALAALVGVGNRTAYSVAKAGVLGLTRSITFDYARVGIRCNAVCPATTRTPLVENISATYDDPQAFLDHVGGRQFVKRMAEPDEIAASIMFLASPASSYIYGCYLAADGGLTATSPSD